MLTSDRLSVGSITHLASILNKTFSELVNGLWMLSVVRQRFTVSIVYSSKNSSSDAGGPSSSFDVDELILGERLLILSRAVRGKCLAYTFAPAWMWPTPWRRGIFQTDSNTQQVNCILLNMCTISYVQLIPFKGFQIHSAQQVYLSGQQIFVL